jgi:hypothetical protein
MGSNGRESVSSSQLAPTTWRRASIYAYQNDELPDALAAIERLSKMDIIKLVKVLFTQRGHSQEFIGEDCDQAIHTAAEKKVRQLWPDL